MNVTTRPICAYCQHPYDPETLLHDVDGQDDHWPEEQTE